MAQIENFFKILILKNGISNYFCKIRNTSFLFILKKKQNLKDHFLFCFGSKNDPFSNWNFPKQNDLEIQIHFLIPNFWKFHAKTLDSKSISTNQKSAKYPRKSSKIENYLIPYSYFRKYYFYKISFCGQKDFDSYLKFCFSQTKLSFFSIFKKFGFWKIFEAVPEFWLIHVQKQAYEFGSTGIFTAKWIENQIIFSKVLA